MGGDDLALIALAEAVSNLDNGASLMPLLREALRAEEEGRMRDACNQVTIVGINILRMGPAHVPLAERIFQHAVFLAKKWDTVLPECAIALLEGQNVKLADAYNWLANAENALGKAVEAESHQQSALKAVRDMGILETSLRSLHYSRQLRTGQALAKFEPFLKEWTQRIVSAAEEGMDCTLDLLEASAAALQERAQVLLATGKLPEAAALHAGPLLAVVARVEGIPMRRRPGQPSAVLPATPAFVVMETAAQLWAQTGDPFAAEMGLRLVVAFRAASLGWEGFEPPALEDYDPIFPTEDIRNDDRWNSAAKAGPSLSAETARQKVLLPDGVFEQLMARTEEVAGSGDSWDMKGGPVEGMQHFNDLGQRLFNLANLLYAGKRWGEAARMARSAAKMLAGLGPQQGAALHLVGAASFHQGPKSHKAARKAFEAASQAKDEDIAGRMARKEPVSPDEQAQYVETLLFLGHVCWELQDLDQAESVHGKALTVARERLDNKHLVLKKALDAMISLKQKIAALQQIRR